MASRAQIFLEVTVGTGLLMLGIAGAQARAATVTLATFSGDTTNNPTWNRPEEGSPPTQLSGRLVLYSSQPFYVNTSSSYDFLSKSQNPLGWDNYTFLYQGSFNPSNPLNRVLIGSSDLAQPGQSSFSYNLTANQQYFFITSGLTENDYGTFSNTISGPSGSKVTLNVVPFVFSPGLGLSILGAWFGISQLKTKAGKFRSSRESQDHDESEAAALKVEDNS
jgi:hypothetical protein